MAVPDWALSLSYWLHMLATVAWIGGLAAVSTLTLPLIAQLPDPDAQVSLLHRTQKRLDPLGWFCLLLLTGTGLVQMSASDQYEGFLSIANAWAQAILIKHIVFFGMIAVSGYLTWSALPELGRAALRRARGLASDPGEVERLFRKHGLLLRINLLLGLAVLGLTALARVAG